MGIPTVLRRRYFCFKLKKCRGKRQTPEKARFLPVGCHGIVSAFCTKNQTKFLPIHAAVLTNLLLSIFRNGVMIKHDGTVMRFPSQTSSPNGTFFEEENLL